MSHRDPAIDARYRSRHEREMDADAAACHATSSGSSVELCLVDPGDGDIHVVMTAKTGAVTLRRESIALDSPGLGTWLRSKLSTHCPVPRKGPA